MTNVAGRIWDVVEPIAANIYFAPEAHAAYHEIGFDGPSRVVRQGALPGHGRLLHEPRGVPRPERRRTPRPLRRSVCSSARWSSPRSPTAGAAPIKRRCSPHASVAVSRRCVDSSATNRKVWAGRRRCCSEWSTPRRVRGAPCSPGCSSLGYPTIRWARSGGRPTSSASTAATATSRRGSAPTSTHARSACSRTRGAASR